MSIVAPLGETRVNTGTAGSQTESSVTRLANGGWIVTWTTDQGISGAEIHQQRYAANGQTIGSETLVNTFNAGFQGVPCVTALSDGGWLVTWTSNGQDGSGYGIYQQQYSSEGGKAAAETRVNTTTEGNQWIPSVTALAGGGWIVTWASINQDGSGWGIYQQQYSSAGETFGAETRVNTTTEGNQWRSSVTALAGGGWIVTWASPNQSASGDDIYQQQYSSKGVQVGTETRVNTVTAGDQQHSSVTGLSDGGWVVVWTSYLLSGSISDIYQQRYQANGTPVGGETRVSTIPVNTDKTPSVVALADGGWLVTYTSVADNIGYDIFQQRYAANGGKVGGEIQVNSVTAGHQQDPSVTALSDGGWLITWTSAASDSSGNDIHQQRFAADGQKIGPTTPTGLTLAALTISEGLSAPAGQLTAKALVTDGGFTYTLLDDAGGRFALSAAGALTVKDGIRLDYEQARSHQIKVLVKDALGASYEQWLDVAVADVDSENLTGSAAADLLKGGRFKDTFNGGAGNDKLWGGAGNDVLKGSTGRDTFVFDTRLNKHTNVDKIVDFKSRDDSFHLDNAIFTKLGRGTDSGVRFKSDMFVEGTRAKDREDRIVYDKKTGALYYDQDGTGSRAQVKIATLSNKTKLYYHDFYVI